MKFEFDTLKCAKMLAKGGLATSQAEVMIGSLSNVEMNNIYSKTEINGMLHESFYKAVDECRREFDARMAERNRLIDKQIDRQIEKDSAERKAMIRWIVGTIITCTLALASYLSALIHITH